jgi:hypothetical protein
VPGLPAELEKLVQRCLRKDPAKRFQSMGDVALELEEVTASLDTTRAQPRRKRPGRRAAWLLSGAALVSLVAFIATAIVLWSPGRARPPGVTLDPLPSSQPSRTGPATPLSTRWERSYRRRWSRERRESATSR